MFPESATLIGIFVSSFGIGIATSALPGPIVFYLVDRAMESGFGAAMLFFAGVLAVDAFVIVSAIVGLGGVLGAPLFTGITASLGGVFLAWTGLNMLRRSGSYSLRSDAIAAAEDTLVRRKSIHPILTGISITVANPLYWIWWATVGLGYINWMTGIGEAALITFIGGLMGGVILFHVLLAFVFAKGRKLFSDKFYRGVVFISGGILTAFGLYFVFLGIENLSSL